jgi:hypothetical protein
MASSFRYSNEGKIERINPHSLQKLPFHDDGDLRVLQGWRVHLVRKQAGEL